MATAEELLNQAATYNAGSVTKSYLTVDLRTRVINVPSDVKILGVESDDEVNRLYFKIPRYYDDVDLSEFMIRINYKNANGDGDLYHVGDSVIEMFGEEDFITFSWLVGRFAFTKQGNVDFVVCMVKTDEFGIIEQEFNTTICSLPVLKGLETSGIVVDEERDAIQAAAIEAAEKALEGFTPGGDSTDYGALKLSGDDYNGRIGISIDKVEDYWNTWLHINGYNVEISGSSISFSSTSPITGMTVAEPAGEGHAVNKRYVDNLVGDIETVLDRIIAMQNSLIGGDA